MNRHFAIEDALIDARDRGLIRSWEFPGFHLWVVTLNSGEQKLYTPAEASAFVDALVCEGQLRTRNEPIRTRSVLHTDGTWTS